MDFPKNTRLCPKLCPRLQAKFNSLQAKLNAEKKDLAKLEGELEKQSLMLSLDAKEDKRRELEKKKRHYKYLYDEYTIEMKGEEMELTRRIGKEIEKIVAKIGKEKGFEIIMESRSVGLLYHNETIDITDQVIKAYDRSKK